MAIIIPKPGRPHHGSHIVFMFLNDFVMDVKQ